MMGSASSFPDFIQARDAAGLQTYMTTELIQVAHRQRNNQALFEACRDGADEICEVLISFGADVNSAVGNGRTPLMATASEDSTPIGLTLDQIISGRCRCMRSLIAAGVAIDQTCIDGWTALMYAMWNRLDRIRLTEILVEAGANVNKLNNNRESALYFAINRNNVDVVELLLESGAYFDAVNVNGWTPMHVACINLNPRVVESLLRHNADIDIVDNRGVTALQKAISCPPTSPNRVAVLQLMATCAQTRLEASSTEWIRLARNERNRP